MFVHAKAMTFPRFKLWFSALATSFGILSRDSPFVQECLRYLDELVHQPPPETESDEEPSAELRFVPPFQGRPQTAAERSVDAAIRLGLEEAGK